MKRIHLFEFEDLHWFPGFLRDYGTDFLKFLAVKTKMYRPTIPILANALEKVPIYQIIDLGSGAGGGLYWINKELQALNIQPKIILTDLFPNLKAFKHLKTQDDNFDFIEYPVDARKVPQELQGLRTQFLSLHHFNPEDAKKILQNAVDSKQGIAIFEGQERSIPSLLGMFLSPISVFLTAPFIRPVRLGRLLFTYLLPVVPLFVWWDGVVSCLRTYSVKEMKELVEGLENRETFDWEINKIKSGPAAILYLVGTLKKTDNNNLLRTK